jgi:hypothetical protein
MVVLVFRPILIYIFSSNMRIEAVWSPKQFVLSLPSPWLTVYMCAVAVSLPSLYVT